MVNVPGSNDVEIPAAIVLFVQEVEGRRDIPPWEIPLHPYPDFRVVRKNGVGRAGHRRKQLETFLTASRSQ